MRPTDRAAAKDFAERPLLVAGRRLGGRYLLLRPLGLGGMAAVWLATDERLGRPVAIKVLSDTVAGDEEFLQRFSREARVAAGLQHPHLVQIYDFDAGERPYLVMEYIEGGTLAERFADREPPAAERLARELLGALRHIHSNGVLHRDVKPHNVLIDAGGHARLTDFGIAQPSERVGAHRGRQGNRHRELHGARGPPRRAGERALGPLRHRGRARRGRGRRGGVGGAVVADRPAARTATRAIARPARRRHWRFSSERRRR